MAKNTVRQRDASYSTLVKNARVCLNTMYKKIIDNPDEYINTSTIGQLTTTIVNSLDKIEIILERHAKLRTVREENPKSFKNDPLVKQVERGINEDADNMKNIANYKKKAM